MRVYPGGRQGEVLRQLQSGGKDDNTLVEKALLTALVGEPHIIQIRECWYDSQVSWTVCLLCLCGGVVWGGEAAYATGRQMCVKGVFCVRARNVCCFPAQTHSHTQSLYTVMEYGDCVLLDYVLAAPGGCLDEPQAMYFFRQFLLGACVRASSPSLVCCVPVRAHSLDTPPHPHPRCLQACGRCTE